MVAVGPNWGMQIAPHGRLCDGAGRHGVVQPPTSLCFPRPGPASIPAASSLSCRVKQIEILGVTFKHHGLPWPGCSSGLMPCSCL